MKRKGEDRQLRREEVEASLEEESEEEGEEMPIGNFPRADPETLKARKKLKIVRPRKFVHNKDETSTHNPFATLGNFLSKPQQVKQIPTSSAPQENENLPVTRVVGDEKESEVTETNGHEEELKEKQNTDRTNEAETNDKSKSLEPVQATEEQNKDVEANINEEKGDDVNVTQSTEEPDKKTETSKPLFSFSGSSTIPKFSFSSFSKTPFSTSTSLPSGFSSFPSSTFTPPKFTFSAPPLKFTTSTTTENKKTNDNDDENDGSESAPPEPKTILKKAEYPDEDILYEVRAKLQKFREDKEKEGGGQWVDLGTGNFCILKHKTNEKTRLVMRNQIGKVLLNCYMFPNMFFNKQKNGVMFGCNTGEIEKVFLRVNASEFSNLVLNLESNVPK